MVGDSGYFLVKLQILQQKLLYTCTHTQPVWGQKRFR